MLFPSLSCSVCCAVSRRLGLNTNCAALSMYAMLARSLSLSLTRNRATGASAVFVFILNCFFVVCVCVCVSARVCTCSLLLLCQTSCCCCCCLFLFVPALFHCIRFCSRSQRVHNSGASAATPAATAAEAELFSLPFVRWSCTEFNEQLRRTDAFFKVLYKPQSTTICLNNL